MPNADKLSDNKLLHYDPIVKMEHPHEDARGGIQPLVNEEMKSAVMISSKKERCAPTISTRRTGIIATCFQEPSTTTGAPSTTEKSLGTCALPRATFFTPPLIEHAMVFAEDTVFLCLGRNPRDQATYEADIERVQVYPF